MRQLLLLLFWLAQPAAWAQAAPASLVNEVNANRDWTADLATCPADLLPTTHAHEYRSDVRQQCESAQSQAACLAACKAGEAEHCYWLGNAVQSASDNEKAADVLFQRACRLGIPSGCTNRATRMMPTSKDFPKAASCPARTFERTCAAKDTWGCAMRGLILSRDKSDPRNKERALEALKKACQFGEADAACRAATSLRKELQR